MTTTNVEPGLEASNSVAENNQHPLYSDRQNLTVTIRGESMPGWFTGEAAIWTGGANPKIVGPFQDVKAAMQWQTDNAQGSQIFPYYPPVI